MAQPAPPRSPSQASPFPGMDPYLEQPDFWVEFHNDLAGEIRAQLNRSIQPRYVARLTPSVTYDLIEIAELRTIRPDVAVHRQSTLRESGGTIESAPTITPAPLTNFVPYEVPVELLSVEIRGTEHQALVTAIEILSPVNKRPGHQAYLDYRRKRSDLLHSSAHYLELDLLRGGDRIPLVQPMPRSAYCVMLSRATRRPEVEVWPIALEDPLPVLPVPLLEPDPDAALDLGAAVASVYERGAFGIQIDYRQAPPPPIDEAEAEWLDQHLQAQGRR